MERFVTLYGNHFEFVWRILWRARAPEADINDLVQEAFIVVLRKLRADEPTLPGTRDEELAWLYVIAIYELKNYRQRARFRRVESMDDRTNEIPDARNDAAHLEAQEELRTLLANLPRDRREVFELVELEGVSVVVVARTLGITEATAHKRLGLARQDVKEAAAKRAQRDKDAGTKKTTGLLLPFGVGAWLPLRDLAKPPEGTADLIWKRLQDAIARIDQENDPPTRPPSQPPARPRAEPLVKKLVGHLARPLERVFTAGAGGAIVALFFLLRPNAGIAILRVPVPIVVVTTSTGMLTTPPAPSSSAATPTTDTDTIPTAAATIDEETQLMRQARAAYAAGDRPAAIAAFNAYEHHFPVGQFRSKIREMRATLTAADRR